MREGASRLTSSGKNRNGEPLVKDRSFSIGASTIREEPNSGGQKRTAWAPGARTRRNSRRIRIPVASSKCSRTPRFQRPATEASRSGRRVMSPWRKASNALTARASRSAPDA